MSYAKGAVPVAVPYSSDAEDPQDHRPPGYAATCIACGAYTDLVLRGDTFLCRDQDLCQFRVRRREEQ